MIGLEINQKQLRYYERGLIGRILSLVLIVLKLN